MERNRTLVTKSETNKISLIQREPAFRLGKPGDAHEQEADRIADAVVRGNALTAGWSISRIGVFSPAERDDQLMSGSEEANVWRKSESDSSQDRSTPAIVNKVLRSHGDRLESSTRAFMESRIGHDFSHVRIHKDNQASESARAIAARAYTSGSNVVFASGQYSPDTPAGRHLLAHELVHVAQQSPEQALRSGLIQRAGFFQSIARFFGGGTFSETELVSYIDFLKTNKTIEDSYDSDNKAREVVRRWKTGDPTFSILTVPIRILLIKEMASGYLSSDDQIGILGLLEESISSELKTILGAIGISALKRRFDGDYKKRLTRLLSDQEDAEALALLGGKWDAKGVMEILHRHGDEHIIKTILDQGYTIIRFETAFDKWRYADGSIKETELKGLRGNTLRAAKEIRIRDSLSNETAASTLYHEVSHVQSKEPDYLKQEIDVRVETEEFKIRHGLPPTRPQYRNPDGTVNRAFIKKEIESSPHYNPVGRTRIGRRYVNEKTVSGWKMP